MDIIKLLNNSLEKQLKENLNQEDFDNQLLKIFGEGEQECSPEEFFNRTRKAREFARKWNSKK